MTSSGFDFSVLLILLFICIVIGVVLFVFRKFKMPKVGALALVTGGVKCGKSTFGLCLAYKNYKRVHLRWAIRQVLGKPFGINEEEPLFYSNIPVGFDYVELTPALLERKERYRYKSVVFVDEANLLASSQDYKDMSLNERISIFSALFGHETKGGLLVYTCHNLERLHYGIRDVSSQYFYIHHLSKYGIFNVANVREMVVGDDSIKNIFDKDVEDSLQKVLISRKMWKKFDAYCYSILTDSLPVADNVIHGADLPNLKANQLLSFRTWHDEDIKEFMNKFNKTEKKDDVIKVVEHENKKA